MNLYSHSQRGRSLQTAYLKPEKQEPANDEQAPTTLSIAKKAGKFIGRGETVRLKVRNSDGTESAMFGYRRPARVSRVFRR